MKISRTRTAPLAGALLLCAGCGDDDGLGPADVQGTYVLSMVGVNEVPYVYEDDLIRFEIISGSIVLRADGTCSTSFEFEEVDKTTGDVETGPLLRDCTFRISGNNLEFDFGGEVRDYAFFKDDEIRANIDGEVWVFVKE